MLDRVFAFFLLITCSAFSQSVTYYVDSQSGKDANNGTTTSTPWQTLTKINGTTFQAGDKILLKSGSSWSGQLLPKGSGSTGKPIIIDIYGGTVRPKIDGKGTVTDALYLSGGEYWEINSLELTNDAAAAGTRRGAHVDNSKSGVVNHIYLKNLWIHNIKGTVGTDADNTAKRTGGICIEGTTSNTRVDDVLISDCIIDSVDETGIITSNTKMSSDVPNSSTWTKMRFTNLHIINNVIHDVSKNAMIIRLDDHGIIEHNTCYETATQTTGNTMYTISSNGTTFQYNEGYHNRAGTSAHDGCMYDADLRSMNIIFQYSYSHNNSHGLLWFYTVAADSGIICRYNISQNDSGYIIAVHQPFVTAYIYNNVFYCGSGVSPVIIDQTDKTGQVFYFNNIIYNLSSTATFNPIGNITASNNVFFGYHPPKEPTDSSKLVSDPKLVSPGSAGLGWNTTTGYQIKAGSACIGSGIRSFNHPDIDFFGNPIPVDAPIDRGIYQYQTGTAIKDNLNADKSYQLMQNFPNPFNPSTKIVFTLSSPGDVVLKIFNAMGQEVETVFNRYYPAGTHNIGYDGSMLSSGVYFYRLTAGNIVLSKKMLLLK